MSTNIDQRKAFEQKLVELGKINNRIVAVSCDSASGGGLSSFFKEFPDRSVEIGISEQTAVSVCAALSMQNFIPVLVIINPFLTMRAFEQIRDDLGYAKTNVKIVGSGGGLAYSTLGASHIALEDIALMNTVPNLKILAPGDADEVEAALEEAINTNGPVYIRMPRQARPLPKPTSERVFIQGKAELLRDGNDVALCAYGPSVCEAMKASDILAEKNISAAVLSFLSVKPLDSEAILHFVNKGALICTIEEQIPFGGLGMSVSKIIADEGKPTKLVSIAVPEGSKRTGPYEELLDAYGLSGKKIAENIINHML
jgi:transketolase